MLQFFRTGPVFTAMYRGHAFIIRAVVNGIELQVHNGTTGKTEAHVLPTVAEATARAEEIASKLEKAE